MNITKESIITAIAKSEKEDISTVRSIYSALEKKIFESLSSVTPENNSDNPISIKLFEGISIDGTYVPDKQKKLNFVSDSDKVITVKGGIKAKANITRNYQKKLNT